jgi:hypothetical protein
MGAWFEAQVAKVTVRPKQSAGEDSGSSCGEEGPAPVLCYHIVFDDYKEDEPTQLTAAHVRPRARYRYQWSQVGHYIISPIHLVWD